jgi:alpha-N-acetylglucosaminidase
MRVLSGTGKFVVFVALGAAALASVAGATQSGGLDGLYSLIQRRIPAHNQSFNFILAPGDSTLDTFTLNDADRHGRGNTQINIQCTSISACARGLYM